jgi:tetratricopeptide (TPR) repeat protein
MAYFNQDQYQEAIGYYLNALSLNPNAVHIWDYMKSAAFHLRDKKMMELVKQRNIDGFRGQYDIINP